MRNFIKLIRDYKRMEQIINLYEERMLKLFNFEKYAETGKCLLSAVVPHDTVYLIGSSESAIDLFSREIRCQVLSVEFVGGNNSIIHLHCQETGREYIVHNNDYGKIFFPDKKQAGMERERRDKFWRRKWVN